MANMAIKIIDSTNGSFAGNVTVETRKIVDGSWQLISEMRTNLDGHTLLADDTSMQNGGYYEVTAFLGEYFNQSGYALPQMKFVDILSLRFGLDKFDDDCEIVLSVTPYGYTVVHT